MRDLDTLVELLERVQVCFLPTSEGSLARHAAATLHRTACRQSQSCKHGLRAAAQERQVNWVVREYGNSASIPTSVLLSFLRQELQARHCAGAYYSSAARACAPPHRPAAGSEPAAWRPPLPLRRRLCTQSRLALPAGRAPGGDAVLCAGGRAGVRPRGAPAGGAPLHPRGRAAARAGQHGWLCAGALLAGPGLWQYALPHRRQPLRAAGHGRRAARLVSSVTTFVVRLHACLVRRPVAATSKGARLGPVPGRLRLAPAAEAGVLVGAGTEAA
jgi:hypothetical protein